MLLFGERDLPSTRHIVILVQNLPWVQNFNLDRQFEFVFLFLLPTKGNAQDINDTLPVISMQEAVNLAKENYPLLKQKQLEINKQEQLKGQRHQHR